MYDNVALSGRESRLYLQIRYRGTPLFIWLSRLFILRMYKAIEKDDFVRSVGKIDENRNDQF